VTGANLNLTQLQVVSPIHRIVEDSTINARRFRKDSAQRFAEFRWWGCVLLAMFATVQTARVSNGPTAVSEPVRSDDTQLRLTADAACKPTRQAVTIDAAPPSAACHEGNANAGDSRIQTR